MTSGATEPRTAARHSSALARAQTAAGLVWFEVRRVGLSPGALAVPLVAALLARPVPSPAPGAVPAALHDGARAGWIGAALVLAWVGAARAARFGADWHARDSSFLGALPLRRWAIAGAALLGITLGAAIPCAVTAGVLSRVAPGPSVPLELVARSGPENSIRLAPGERLAHALSRTVDSTGAVARVRVAPTVGGTLPATRVRVRSGAADAVEVVARRRYIEVPLAPGALSIENVGQGALAVLGPAPFEVWQPSRAVLGGHARMGAHVLLACAVLFAAALAASPWISPLLAAGLGLALLVAPALFGGAPTWAPLPGSGGPLVHGIDALGAGRAPNAPAPAALLCVAAAFAAAVAAAGPALSSSPDGGRR